MFDFSTLSAVIIILFILIFLFLCILRCRMSRAEHKDHALYNLFFSKTAHRGSILVPDTALPQVSKEFKGSRSSSRDLKERGSKRGKRRHSAYSVSIEIQSSALHKSDSARKGRLGSAPVDVLSHSINLYTENELTNRQRLYRCNQGHSASLTENRRRGSAPMDLLTHSVSLYKGNEITDRHRLFRCNSASVFNDKKNSIGFKARQTNIPEEVEIKITPD